MRYASRQCESAGSQQEGALVQGSMTRYIPQMLQPDWSELSQYGIMGLLHLPSKWFCFAKEAFTYVICLQLC